MVSQWTSWANFHLPEKANAIIMQRAIQSSRIFRSGAVATVDIPAPAPSPRVVTLPYWNQPNEDSQPLDEGTDIEVMSLSGDYMTAPVIARALAWGSYDLQKLFTGEDPVGAVMNAIGDYWGKDWDKVAVAVLTGFMNTVAGGGSMAGNILDVSEESGASAFIDADLIIDGSALMGEDQDAALRFLITHPLVYANMKKQDLISIEKPSEGGDPIATYEGKTVVVSNRAPVEEVSGVGTVYTTILAGAGSLGFKEGAHPEGPGVEVVREGLKGGGRTSLVSRRVGILHPIGANWNPVSGVPAKDTVSNVELANPANWERAFELDNVRLVGVKHLLP